MATQTSELCPVLATDQHGLVTGENMASLALSTYARTSGTVVNITCYVPSTYKLQGSSQVTCKEGTWIPSPPVCVRKDGLSPDGSDIEDIIKNMQSKNNSDTSNIVLVVTASLSALILFLVVAFLVYRFCISRSKAHSDCCSLDDVHTDGKIPRVKSPFNGVVQVYSTSPSQSTSTAYHWVHGTWPSQPQAWTYLSVDRLLRDIERSRRENPRHSWRDFASISTRYSTRRL